MKRWRLLPNEPWMERWASGEWVNIRDIKAEESRLQYIGAACGFPVVQDTSQLTETICKAIRRRDEELVEMRSEIERLRKQAQSISVLLSDAGCQAMPIPDGVRWLASEIERLKEVALRAVDDEDEASEPMPEHMRVLFMQRSLEEIVRCTIAATKAGIRARLAERLSMGKREDLK